MTEDEEWERAVAADEKWKRDLEDAKRWYDIPLVIPLVLFWLIVLLYGWFDAKLRKDGV